MSIAFLIAVARIKVDQTYAYIAEKVMANLIRQDSGRSNYQSCRSSGHTPKTHLAVLHNVTFKSQYVYYVIQFRRINYYIATYLLYYYYGYFANGLAIPRA